MSYQSWWNLHGDWLCIYFTQNIWRSLRKMVMTFSSDRLKSHCFFCCLWPSFWDIARQKQQLVITHHVGMFFLHVIPFLMCYLTIIPSPAPVTLRTSLLFVYMIPWFCSWLCFLYRVNLCMSPVPHKFLWSKTFASNYALKYFFRCAIKAESFRELKAL